MLSKIFNNEPKFSKTQLQFIQESLQSREKLFLTDSMFPCISLGLNSNRIFGFMISLSPDSFHSTLSATQIKQVAEIFKTNTTTTLLSLKNFNLNSDTIEYLAKALEENHTLKQLNLYCDINDKGLNALAVLLNKNNTIAHLLINSSKRFIPSEDTINNISAFFKTNTSLVSIDLPIEGFLKEQHFITFIEAFRCNKNIIHFNRFCKQSINFDTKYLPQIKSICNQNYQEAEAIIDEYKTISYAHFTDIGKAMISRIAERKSALKHMTNEGSLIKAFSLGNHFSLDKPFQKLITESNNILISLSGYHLNPYHQLRIAKTFPPQQNEQIIGFNLLLDLPPELQQHIFSYVPFRSIASLPSKPIVPAILPQPSIPNTTASSPFSSFFAKMIPHIKKFFVNLFQCIFSPSTTQEAPSSITQPSEPTNKPSNSMIAPKMPSSSNEHNVSEKFLTKLQRTSKENARSR